MAAAFQAACDLIAVAVRRTLVALGRDGKIGVEFLLLFGGKQPANLIVRAGDERLMLGAEVLVKLHHLVVRIVHQVLNLSKLIRGQAQIAIEPIDESSVKRNVQNLMAIGEVGKSKTDQYAGNHRDGDCRPFETIAQSRCWPPAYPR